MDVALPYLKGSGVAAKERASMDRSEFERLLALNYAVVDALREVEELEDSKLAYAGSVARKRFQHAETAFALWTQHTKVSGPGIPPREILDWPSIQVLVRACLETYLTFHYIYIEPGTDQEKFEFRYNAWFLAGFTKRGSFPAKEEASKRQQALDMRRNKELRRQIRQMAPFKALDPEQQEAVLGGYNCHPGKTLSDMAAETFGPRYGRAVYSYLSSPTHSDALSVVQMKQAVLDEDASGRAEKMANVAISQIGIVL